MRAVGGGLAPGRSDAAHEEAMVRTAASVENDTVASAMCGISGGVRPMWAPETLASRRPHRLGRRGGHTEAACMKRLDQLPS